MKFFQQFFPKAELYGCDVSSESLNIAKTNCKEIMNVENLFCNTPIEEFRKKDKQWDLIFLACVMHHIEPADRKEWIRAIADKISIGGYLAIFEHNIINPCTKKIILDPKNYVDRIDFMLSQKQLIKLLLETYDGFSVYWKGYTLFSPIRFRGIVAIESLLKWLPLGAQHCVIVRKDK